MDRLSASPQRLPRNFHRTFVPERRYVSAMLFYAASGRGGTPQDIAQATGIPTGASTGKAPAILDYCRGMGLVRLAGPARSSTKHPELTDFGRTVLLEDPYLKEPVTQWLAHLHLCGVAFGADAWYQTFFAGAQYLGMHFSREKLEEHLGLVYGGDGTGLIGPLVRTYEDDAALRACGALRQEAGIIRRMSAPVSPEDALPYGAWLLHLMKIHFPGGGQVTVTELDAEAGWRTIPGWDLGQLQEVLNLVERKGLIEVDRQMQPWLLRPAAVSEEVWKLIYSDLT